MGNSCCSWVRDRLPLLAGHELRGLDRRRAERHLIGCPSCREHRTALEGALAVLHAARVEEPSRSAAPSLWPALAEQIRQSRRPARTSLFAWPRPFFLRPALGFGFALGLLAAGGGIAAARIQIARSTARMITDAQPIAVLATKAVADTPAALPAPSPEPVESPVADNSPAPAPRRNYDLDHAYPMGPMGSDGRDGKQSTY